MVVSFSIGVSLSIISLPSVSPIIRTFSYARCFRRPSGTGNIAALPAAPGSEGDSQHLFWLEWRHQHVETAQVQHLRPEGVAGQTKENNVVRGSRQARHDIQKVIPVAAGVVRLA